MFADRLRPEHVDAVRNLFAPRKPRHPLLRIAVGLVGLALLAVLVVIGLVVGVAMLAGGAGLTLDTSLTQLSVCTTRPSPCPR